MSRGVKKERQVRCLEVRNTRTCHRAGKEDGGKKSQDEGKGDKAA